MNTVQLLNLGKMNFFGGDGNVLYFDYGSGYNNEEKKRNFSKGLKCYYRSSLRYMYVKIHRTVYLYVVNATICNLRLNKPEF